MFVCSDSRVKSLLEGSSGTVAVGGESDEKTKYIAPTLLVDVEMSDSVMKDEVCIRICAIYSY